VSVRRRRSLLVLPVALALATAVPAVPLSPAASDPGTFAPATTLAPKVLGKTSTGRKIMAWHFVQHAEQLEQEIPTVVLMSTMHGDEPHTQQILSALRDGPPVRDLDLWVIPVYNPDGLARGTRKNARGVDLNRNFPYHWADLDGSYESGPNPASEPETRAMMRFLRKVRPDFILSFHQPLKGVDTDTKRPAFARKVARHLNLPAKRLDCGGVCHGTMTGWYNHNFKGAALTVEYGAHPPRRLMRRIAPRQVLAIFGAHRSAAPLE
jgi:protein MpaA